MISITCKCGKQTITFQHLLAQDFPNGWVTDCCKTVVVLVEAPKVEVKKVEETPIEKEERYADIKKDIKAEAEYFNRNSGNKKKK